MADSIQETFGITRLEAMAAELPCLVNDSDGYRDTIVHACESDEPKGIRIATRMTQSFGTAESISCVKVQYQNALRWSAVDGHSCWSGWSGAELEQLLDNENLLTALG